MTKSEVATALKELPPRARPSIAPVVRSALGIAVGLHLGALLGALGLYHAVVPEETASALWVWLIGNNFLPGYAPTVPGALVGFLWGSALGFVIGFLAALVRNAAVSVTIFWIAARERARANRNVLDELV